MRFSNILAIVATLTLSVQQSLAVPGNGNGNQKQTVCHGTSSDTNPYDKLSLPPPAVATHLSDQHNQGKKWRDGLPGDKTWDGGVLDENCKIVYPPPTASPTAKPAPTSKPTTAPTKKPTLAPTPGPTALPTASPTVLHHAYPTKKPAPQIGRVSCYRRGKGIMFRF